jgi:hypothetical protein
MAVKIIRNTEEIRLLLAVPPAKFGGSEEEYIILTRYESAWQQFFNNDVRRVRADIKTYRFETTSYKVFLSHARVGTPHLVFCNKVLT